MKFHTFIQKNLEALADEWESFLRTAPAATKMMQNPAFETHCRKVLTDIVKHMQPNSTAVNASVGIEDGELPTADSKTGAAAHGASRHAAGFGLAQLLGEFRVLRSSVFALWRRSPATGGIDPTLEDTLLFDEALDQALGESVQSYSNDAAKARDTFLAVLGHDLRGPLHSVQVAGDVLMAPQLSDVVRFQTAMRVTRASKIMNGLITDLLEFTGSRIGREIPIERSDCDLRQACEEALDAIKAVEPDREFIQQVSGDLRIRADGARLRQVLSNLLNNAVQHGGKRTPVSLSASGEEHEIVLAVTNCGRRIPPEALQIIFDPLVQVPSTTSDVHMRPKTSLGLGLFIAREIVRGHHGTIEVTSSETVTVFTIRLPRIVPKK